jgi:hypothetical protein
MGLCIQGFPSSSVKLHIMNSVTKNRKIVPINVGL